MNQEYLRKMCFEKNDCTDLSFNKLLHEVLMIQDMSQPLLKSKIYKQNNPKNISVCYFYLQVCRNSLTEIPLTE